MHELNCCFLVSSIDQKTLEGTATVGCFLIIDSNLQTRYRKIISKLSLRAKVSIILSSKNEIQAIQYENVGLQVEIQARDHQNERCKNTITHLRERYLDHTRDPGKQNIICKKTHNFNYWFVSLSTILHIKNTMA